MVKTDCINGTCVAGKGTEDTLQTKFTKIKHFYCLSVFSRLESMRVG